MIHALSPVCAGTPLCAPCVYVDFLYLILLSNKSLSQLSRSIPLTSVESLLIENSIKAIPHNSGVRIAQ